MAINHILVLTAGALGVLGTLSGQTWMYLVAALLVAGAFMIHYLEGGYGGKNDKE